MSGRRTVWVVDDSPLDGARALSALSAHYETRLFNDGSTALERLSQSAPPDVLVLDWVMPGISGLDVCKYIRSAGSGLSEGVAVLLLTSHQRTEQVVEGLAAGANDYLCKPYAEEELRARVRALVRSQEVLERAEQAERAVHALLDSSPDALIAMDEAGTITYANTEAERVLGMRSGGFIGRAVADVIPGFDVAFMTSALEKNSPLEDLEIGGELYAPTVRLMPTERAKGSTMISLRNVTEQRHRHARRLDFYAIVAHDLRSPLGSILGRTEMLLAGVRGAVSEQVAAELTKVKRNADSMISLISDFLNVAQLESLAYRVERHPLDLVGLLSNVLNDLEPQIEKAKHALEVSVPEAPAIVLGDEARLAQVMTNLVSNAVKFTPPGGALRVGIRSKLDTYEVSVRDNGPGMDTETAAGLGQRYFRARSSGVPGTGLGMMIITEILKAHGTSLEIETQLAGGSSFCFSLPRASKVDPARSFE